MKEESGRSDQTLNDELDENEHRSMRIPYAVGYRKPPLGTRFKKNQSGNPAGRPKGALSKKTISAALADILLNSSVTLKAKGGAERRVSRLEAILIDAGNRAVAGGPREKKFIIELVEKYLIEVDSGRIEESAEEDEAILRRHGLDLAVGQDAAPSEASKAGEPDDGSN